MTLSDDQRVEIVKLRLKNASQSLSDSATLFKKGSLRSAINRCYYAAFYAASALAVSEGQSFRKHTGLISWFHLEYIKGKRLPRELGRILQESFNNRSEADYQDHIRFTSDDVAQSIKDVKKLGNRSQGSGVRVQGKEGKK